MTITYFLGNGFDLALGLKTRYRDFLKSYKGNSANDTPIANLLKTQIDENSETWADAEEAFGQLDFSSFAESLKMPLLDVIVGMDEDFQRELRNYLIREEESFNQKVSQEHGFASRLLLNAVSSMQDVIASKSFFDSIIRTREDEQLVVNFITLNYTTTIDILLGDSSGGSIAISNEFWESRGFEYMHLGEVVHAHGRLSDKFRLFGVNDSNQIVDKATSELCEEYGLLIKTKEDLYTPVGERARTEEVIKGSDFIIMLGVSYGVTDSYWWDFIAQTALGKSRVRKVILSPYTENPTVYSTPGAAIIRASKEVDRFYSKVDNARLFNKFTRDRCAMLSEGPYTTTDRQEVFCDPLGLSEIRRSIFQK